VFIRPESLSVKGQEPDFVYVIMQNINKYINIIACRPTTKKE
jgi:hypothetical protein